MLTYTSYKAGYLPVAGGMLDQHCLFESLMYLIDSTISHAREVSRSKEQEKHTVVLDDRSSSGKARKR